MKVFKGMVKSMIRYYIIIFLYFLQPIEDINIQLSAPNKSYTETKHQNYNKIKNSTPL